MSEAELGEELGESMALSEELVRAAGLAGNEAERRFLARRASELVR